MTTGLGLAALIVAVLFTGAALYINWAEHPARMKLSREAALAHWAPSYRRGYAMQATLVVVAGLLGIAQFAVVDRVEWLAGAVLILANWPYTLAFVMPVNRMLLELAETQHSDEAETKRILARWNRMHAGRTLLGALASACYIAALI